MGRKLLFSAVILTLLALVGCIDEATVISVKKDGSGTVVSTLYMTKAMQEMMKEMAGAMGGKTKGKQKNPLLESAEAYRAKASAMGEGVTFVSSKEVRKPDGTTGVQVTYAYKDINKLKINSEPETPAGGPEGAASPEGGPPQKKANPVTFEFVKGATPKLTIMMARKEKEEEAVKAEDNATPEEAPAAEQMAMMKEMFDGFHMQLLVAVDGEITKSNATFVEKDEKTGKRQRIILIDMDLGKIFKDEASFKKLAAMGEIQDMATAREKLKDLPGLRFETEEKVEIEFK